ncbi:MAG: EutN/CcmL family microcompartment protein [Calditrichia bacterium]
MLLAKVIGTVVSTRKEEKMSGMKFLLLKPVDIEAQPLSGQVVAVDAVGAGLGEMVLYATGSSARQTELTKDRPCDAVIMAIVDNWEVDGVIKYKKGQSDQ